MRLYTCSGSLKLKTKTQYGYEANMATIQRSALVLASEVVSVEVSKVLLVRANAE